MGIALAVFTLLRLALAVRYGAEWEPSLTRLTYVFGVGLVYDAAFCSYAALPGVFWALLAPTRLWNSRGHRLAVYTTVLAALYALFFSTVAEWLFWGEFGTRFNFIAVDYLIYTREVSRNIWESYPLVWILGGLLAATVLTFEAVRPRLDRALVGTRDGFHRRLRWALPALLAAALAGGALGQTLRGRSANNYANELASNGPYQFAAAFRNNTLDYQAFYPQGDPAALSGVLRDRVIGTGPASENEGLFDIARVVEGRHPPRRANVVLVTVESLSAKYLTRFGGGGSTPFLDDWLRQGWLFTHFYATGTRTDRGLEAITLSIPPTPGRSLVKRPKNGHLYSLGKVFRDNGYDVAFFYGGRGFFDNMNAFFAGNGYRVVDQTRMRREEISFENAWGVADEDLYRRVVKEADVVSAEGRPFFFHVLTTSNHRPYTYPEGKVDLPSGSGRQGALQYTDFALRQLMDASRRRPWFADTLFVLVADHCAGSAGRIGLDASTYHIPLFLYAPGWLPPREIDTLASQIDLAPTLLALLGFGYESHFFGRDILAPGFPPRALVGNYQTLGLLTAEDDLVLLSPVRRLQRQQGEALRPLTPASPLAQEAMAYYQGADYLIRHQLNRWR